MVSHYYDRLGGYEMHRGVRYRALSPCRRQRQDRRSLVQHLGELDLRGVGGKGNSNLVVVHVKDGVVLAHEDVSKDPSEADPMRSRAYPLPKEEDAMAAVKEVRHKAVLRLVRIAESWGTCEGAGCWRLAR